MFMTCTDGPVFFEYRERRLRMEKALGTTTCGKGHVHPPWNTTGILRISKCESMCGFCQKETKTAANLRKHVAIHIKNEGLSLSIAEGSSGRGRLEMPPSVERINTDPRRGSRYSDDSSSMNSSINNNSPPQQRRSVAQAASVPESDSFSPSAVLMSMHQHHSQPLTHTRNSYSSASSSSLLPSTTHPQANHTMPVTTFTYPYSSADTSRTSSSLLPTSHPVYGLNNLYPPAPDPFRVLREHKIRTKIAWTVIPASEGLAILEMCKSQSIAQPSAGAIRTPCYNRETLFDEEWQTHMRDVHGVYLLWPETWMRRIEVVDLEPFGGDIGGVNEVIMEN